MKSPSAPPLPILDGDRVTDAVRVQILATEHWNLLATRSMTWNEMFSRASMFLTVLSAAVVALAFVAQATAFGEGFRLFAFVVLPVVLLLGLATYSRLSAINEYDVWLVAGMNRLRHAYLEMAPELEPYFISGRNDDIPGLWQTYSPGWLTQSYTPGTPSFNLGMLLTSTPNVIGAINALVAGVLAALIAETLGVSVAVSATIGSALGLVLLVVLLWSPMRGVARMRRDYRPRFPTEEQTGT
jgi:hypothetical protein